MNKSGYLIDKDNSKISLIDTVYPIGSIYMSINSTNPSTLFGGTWEQLKDRFLLGAGDTYNNGDTGGEAVHSLTVDEMPGHNHAMANNGTSTATGSGGGGFTVEASWNGKNPKWSSYAGGNSPHNNMPPYLVVYMWKRTE